MSYPLLYKSILNRFSISKNMALHTVVIDSKLKPIEITFPPIQSEKSIEQYWLHHVEKNFTCLDYSVGNINKPLCAIVNGPHTQTSSNAILDAFLLAYYQHHDIVLSPDDMWLLVCMYFAEHVNDNVEQLQSTFVEHNKR
jgi:hypothetical protein